MVLWILSAGFRFHIRGFHSLWRAFPKPFCYRLPIPYTVRTPECMHSGLGSFPFARRYSGNRCFFLFLALLRCFSSGGSLHTAMYSLYDDWSSSSRVSPFGNQRIVGYLLLPAAYRSLSRPSSAPGAKASTLRSFLLDHFRVYSVTHWSGLFALCFGVLSYLKDNRLFRCLEYFLSIGFNVQFSRNNFQTFA